MHTCHRVSLLLLACTMSASIGAGACGDYKGRSPLAPLGSFTAAESTFTLAVEPTQLFRRPAVGTGCFSGQAFLVPFNLRLRSDSPSELFLHQVQFQFFDSAGIASRGMAMRQPDLLSHFGNIGIPPLGLREFPFSVPIACTSQRVSGLSIFVETIDGGRAPSSRTLRVDIRR
jgi:hypothetical protein